MRANYDIIKIYSEKIYENFDVFNYMQELKKLDFMEVVLFGDKQKILIDTISKKFYRVWFDKNNKDPEDIKEKKLKNLKYIMEANNNNVTEAEKKILNNFIN